MINPKYSLDDLHILYIVLHINVARNTKPDKFYLVKLSQITTTSLLQSSYNICLIFMIPFLKYSPQSQSESLERDNNRMASMPEGKLLFTQ